MGVMIGGGGDFLTSLDIAAFSLFALRSGGRTIKHSCQTGFLAISTDKKSSYSRRSRFRFPENAQGNT